MKLNLNYLVGISITVFLLFLTIGSSIKNWAPVCFWAGALIVIIKYGILAFSLSNKVKKSNPELFNKHSIGFTLSKWAFKDQTFLNSITAEEKEIVKELKNTFKYLFIFFILFGVSAFVITIF